MSKKPLLPFLTAEESAQVEESVRAYVGYAPTAAAALGALVFGQMYGFQAVAMCHSRAKLRDFEKVLGIKLRDHMPDRTDVSDRILGVRIADELGKFWAVVKGEVTVPGGKAFMDDGEQPDMFRT